MAQRVIRVTFESGVTFDIDHDLMMAVCDTGGLGFDARRQKFVDQQVQQFRDREIYPSRLGAVTSVQTGTLEYV